MKRISKLHWTCGDTTVELGVRTQVMGILNVTPDSFSDGGHFLDLEQAVAHGLRMSEEGADILDVGGESTRPGAAAVSEEEELRRVIPVVRELARRTDRLISIDTCKAAVAERAVEAGARIINDVTALAGDSRMASVAAASRAGVVLMHMRGTPRTMQDDPRYDDVVAEVVEYLQARVNAAVEAGVRFEALAVDPGIGFGKTVEHNLDLLAQLERFAALERPILVGLSRKSFIGRITGREVHDRTIASIAGAVYAVQRGAHLVRVHDVKETCEALRLVDILCSREAENEGVS